VHVHKINIDDIQADYKRYQDSAELLELAIDIMESELDYDCKVKLLKPLHCDPYTYGHVNSSNILLLMKTDDYIKLLKDEYRSFCYAINTLKKHIRYGVR